jgi:predicted nucleic acid-binding Zn ribbon protein
MECSGCGNKSAYRVSFSSSGESCDKCGAATLSTFRFSDVYYKGPGFEAHLAHPEKSPKGNFVTSREHKAVLMRELGVRETGDKIHGARDHY